jgi:predicted acetyltransferase
VLPTHRRRGINTALFRAQLDDMRARGEPISALHASEAGIYESLGYGMASMLGEFRIETARTAFMAPHRRQGLVRLVSREEALAPMRRVYDAVASARAGMVVADDAWFGWRYGEHGDSKNTSSFFAIHETRGEPDAHAVYRVNVRWPNDIPMHELEVRELLAATPEAAMDMWRFLFEIDLIRTVKGDGRPPDDPLLWMLREPRRLHFALSDGMFVRLVDVPAALEARGYAEGGRAVIEVSDAFCPWNDGRYVLEVTGEKATCIPTDDDPDLACRVNELGSTYLGGASFAQLARAGLVTERSDGGIARADALFRTEQAPWCSLPF